MGLLRRKKSAPDEAFEVLSYRQLMWRRFRKHRLAVGAMCVLVVLYTLTTFCGFFAPYDKVQRVEQYLDAPPQAVRMIDADGNLRRPFVYGWKVQTDTEALRHIYTVDATRVYPIRFFVGGQKYQFLGFTFWTDVHLFGVDADEHGAGAPGTIFLFGSDSLGRDLFSRILHGGRITLWIGLIGVGISFFLGCLIGGISGYYGGAIDTVIQRIIEFIVCIPKIPLWIALSAALPDDWSTVGIFMGITVILSLVGWCGLARVVRGKVLQLRDQDYVTAARCAGAPGWWIIFRHLLPGTMSHLIVSITMAIPGMILGETALSFLGLGITAPAVSWGTLLQDAQSLRAMDSQQWLLIPGAFVILTVMSFNFVGDGLRDAVDPHGR